MEKLQSSGVNVKPGDWVCLGCGDHQFAKNATCRKCGTPKGQMGMGGMMGGQMGGMMGGMMGGQMGGMMGGMCGNMKPGDWSCPGCGDHQFAKNATCRKCGTPKPENAGMAAAMGGGMMGP